MRLQETAGLIRWIIWDWLLLLTRCFSKFMKVVKMPLLHQCKIQTKVLTTEARLTSIAASYVSDALMGPYTEANPLPESERIAGLKRVHAKETIGLLGSTMIILTGASISQIGTGERQDKGLGLQVGE